MPRHRSSPVSDPEPSAPTIVYQLKVTLRNIRPPIWRRLLVAGETTLNELHDILQIAMGWSDYHLHMFNINGQNYGTPSPDDMLPMRDDRKVRLQQVASSEGVKLRYEYDFGDSWEHEIMIEAITPFIEGMQVPSCIKGKRACPPEDVGGPWGYESFLNAVRDPANAEHDEMIEWAGGEFDPEAFDIDEINDELTREYDVEVYGF